MSACIGLGGDPLNLRRPREQLVESRPVADVFQLDRSRLLAPKTSAVIEIPGHDPCRLATDAAGKLTLDGQPIRLVSHVALPLRAFQCPRCQKDRYRLHRVNGEWLCRICSGLDYACRHRHRSRPADATPPVEQQHER